MTTWCLYCKREISDPWEMVKIVRANDRKETVDTMPGIYAHGQCYYGNRADWRALQEPK